MIYQFISRYEATIKIIHNSGYFTIYSLLDPGDLLVVGRLFLRQIVNLPEHWRQSKKWLEHQKHYCESSGFLT